MTQTLIGLTVTNDDLLQQAKRLAFALGINVINDDNHSSGFMLVLSPEKLALHDLSHPKVKPISVDFSAGRFGYRRQMGIGKHQDIAKAVGIKSSIKPTIIDATAGFGRDAFIFASLGCEVILLERSKIIAALLKDGILRGREIIGNEIFDRMHLIETDAVNYLRELPDEKKPDVIYLDPMFPDRTKSALVKKEMQYLQNLLGKDEDSEQLFNLALTKAKKRVVVKRPRLAPCISVLKPHYELMGKTVRFDVYLVQN